MAYTTLINDIQAVIKNNGNQEITGQVLQTALVEMVNELGSGYTYKGVATLSTTPDVTTPNIFYLLGAVGTYTNIGDIQHASGIGIAIWNGSAWSYQNVPSSAVVATDTTPTENSTNPVQSGGVYESLLKNIQDNVCTNLLDPSKVKDGYWNNGEGSSSSYRYINIDISKLQEGSTISCMSYAGVLTSMRWVQFYKGTTFKSGVSDVKSTTIPSDVDNAYITFYYSSAYTPDSDFSKIGVFNSASPIWEKYLNYTTALWTETPANSQALARIADIKNIDYIEDDNGTNLLDPDTIHDGYYNGGVTSSSSYKYFIVDISRVQSGTTISFLQNNGNAVSARFINFYKGSVYLTTYNKQNVTSVTAPDYADTMYVTFEVYYCTNGNMVGAFNSASPSWQNYSHFTKALWDTTPNNPQAIARIADLEGLIPNDVLKGKKWCPLGDSFTEGSESDTFDEGIYIGKNKVYPYYIGNRTGINVVNTFFGSGRTLAFPATPGSFVNSVCNPSAAYYYQNIPSDVDYITIYLGINDSHHAPSSSGGDGEDNTGEIPIGTITDTTTATYYGAWNVVLSWLIENRPFAHIGIIVSNGCDTAEYRTAQIAIARKYGIPFIDLNGDDRTPFMIRSTNSDIPSTIRTIRTQAQAVNYPSNTHPNDSAHEFESYFIEAFLKTI